MSEETKFTEPSRSAKKRAAKAVEDLARQLADLPESDWSRLPVTGDLREDIRRARETRGHGARKRQIKHLAGVLRRCEEEQQELRAHLEGIDQVQLEEKQLFHQLETLRDRLCDAELFSEALNEAVRRWPLLDSAALTRLARAVHSGGDRRAFREIFRRLREAAAAGEN